MMAEIKWVKLTVDMFDNRKIKHIRKLPEGNNIVLIWVMLLTMAGRCNAGGMIYLTENIPYSTKMLADELGFDENVILVALTALEQLEMISRDEGQLSIPGWEEHQNVEGMERIREQNRIRKREERDRKKALLCDRKVTSCCDGHTMSRDSHATDIEEDIEEDNKIVSNDTICRTDVQRVVEAWNQMGVNPVSRITATSTRYKMISARIKEYGVDDVLKAIEKINESTFLKGGGSRGWMIDFEWFSRPNNFPKVLEGQYDDKKSSSNSWEGWLNE